MGQVSDRPWLRPWKPGESGNPAGRVPSFLDLAVQVRQITGNGRELVDLLLAIVRGEAIDLPSRNGDRAPHPQRPNLNQRMQAAQLLLDRGWGRAKEVIELLGDATPEQQQQMRRALLESLTDDERTQLRALLQRALARTMTAPPAPPPAPEAPASHLPRPSRL
jgi:DNA-binding MarR family transcriptional regulator